MCQVYRANFRGTQHQHVRFCYVDFLRALVSELDLFHVSCHICWSETEQLAVYTFERHIPGNLWIGGRKLLVDNWPMVVNISFVYKSRDFE